MAKCPAITRSGNACKGVVRPGDTYCVAHDPARQQERQRAASKAGRSRPNNEVEELKADARDLYRAVLAGEVGPRSGAVANQVLNTLLRGVETQRKLRELEELAHELEEVRQAMEERGLSTWHG